ncbi:hypothetical protein PILCRDRAFT_91727 [Piloderma croceum F 1598]|uniref:Uncharacterized protein n=1 Tax=Piloderma croceum (strain F 1598) TaxID=765440 RepID=A0A0C3F951_PILCF|nr:hypothetical protein PILCRDRAFT_91727 [Piloderma croceum F 1598]
MTHKTKNVRVQGTKVWHPPIQIGTTHPAGNPFGEGLNFAQMSKEKCEESKTEREGDGSGRWKKMEGDGSATTRIVGCGHIQDGTTKIKDRNKREETKEKGRKTRLMIPRYTKTRSSSDYSSSPATKNASATATAKKEKRMPIHIPNPRVRTFAHSPSRPPPTNPDENRPSNAPIRVKYRKE